MRPAAPAPGCDADWRRARAFSPARQGFHQMRMRVSERGDGHAAGEVEIALAVLGEEIGAVPAGEGKLAAGVGRKEGRHRNFAVPEIKLPPTGGSKQSQSIRSPVGACQSGHMHGFIQRSSTFPSTHAICVLAGEVAESTLFRWKTDRTSVADACRDFPDIVAYYRSATRCRGCCVAPGRSNSAVIPSFQAPSLGRRGDFESNSRRPNHGLD